MSVRYRIVIECEEVEADTDEVYRLRRAAWEAVSDAGKGNYAAYVLGPLVEVREGHWVEAKDLLERA
jgi:hypothetical protein